MIKNILYVEDGSIDVDELQECLDEETKIIVYRQGAKPPILEQPKEPIKCFTDSMVERYIRTINLARTLLEEAFSFDMTDELRNKLDDVYTELT